MSKIAFIYPGQGAQKAGMGKDFYENSQAARAVYDQASELLGLDMKALCFEENELLDQTEYTQAAMVTTSLAMTEVLHERGIRAHVAAGLSLGEYCAICEAGALRKEDAIRLVRKRGILMTNAVPCGVGTMAAVLGLDGAMVEQVIASMKDVSVANDNCPGQVVISGRKAAVELAAESLKAAGAKKVVGLSVSGPFHSPMLAEAGKALGEELRQVSLRELRIPYVTNVTADYVRDVGLTKELLEKQVYSKVLWRQSMERMIAEGVDTFVEIGPGKTLRGFLRKIDPKAKVYNVEHWEDVETTVTYLGKAEGQ